MAEIVNLNRLRKQRASAEHDTSAAANRTKHGRTGAQKAADAREAERRRALLDGARLADRASGADEPRD